MLKQNEIFFYKGSHSSGSSFFYNSENKALSVVKTHAINFDNDSEGLYLKELEKFEIYKTLSNIDPDEVENGCNQLLNQMDKDFEAMLQF